MSSSDDDYEDEDYLFFKDDAEFKDVTPLPQDDGPRPVVQIAYSDAFRDAFDYFRAIYAAKELSQRALRLTEACIKQNPANYTVWEYRRQIIKHLGSSIEGELEFTKGVMGKNPKNYQMWHHRSEILAFKGEVTKADVERELELVYFVIVNDSKNYHAWQHRVCLLQNPNYAAHFDLAAETQFAHDLISVDYRNNSAWNYLYTLHTHFNAFDKFDTNWLSDTIYTRNANDLQNESSWSFLSGIFNYLSSTQKEHFFYEKTLPLVETLETQVPHVIIAFLLDVYEEMGYEKENMRTFVRNLKTSDPVRLNYWNFVESTILV